jgi:cysteine synthase A
LRQGARTLRAPPAGGAHPRHASCVARLARGPFGICGISNILGAIRLARNLALGPGDNVFTIATDGMDRCPSVLANLEKRRGLLDEPRLTDWFEEIFRGGDASDFLDMRSTEEKNRLFAYKEQVWTVSGEHEVAILLGRRIRKDPRC